MTYSKRFSRNWTRPLAVAVAVLFVGLGCRLSTDELLSAAGLLEEGSSGKIAVIGKDSNIYLIDPGTGARQAITENATGPRGADNSFRIYDNPTWAPSTGQLAFTEFRGSQGGLARASVHILGAGEERSRVVYDDPIESPFYLYWDPTGRFLTFLSSTRTTDLELWFVDEDGSPKLLDIGQPYYWSWSPDGASLVSHVGGSAALNPEGAELRLIDPTSRDIEELDHSPFAFQAPAFEPDGSRVLVSLDRVEGEGGLVALSPEGEYQSTLLRSDRPAAFVWSPSGEKVAYLEASSTGSLAFGELSILDVSGDGEASRVESNLPPVSGLFWSPNGEQLAAFVPEISSPEQEQQVAWSRQDQALVMRLYLVDAESGEGRLLATFRPTGEFLRILPFFDQYAQSATIWSPDGGHLVYTSRREGGAAGVYVITAEPGAEPEMLEEGKLAFWSFVAFGD